MKKKITLAVLCAVLSCVCLIGTTFAWLTDKTDAITNTFTVGNINITLAETTGTSYKMVPGATIKKDPKVTVVAGSEACWLFVKIVENNNTFSNGAQNFVTYTVASGWTELESGVYYRKVNANDSTGTVDEETYSVLANDQIVINEDATATDLAGANNTSLVFTAYAIQQSGFDSAAAAWTELNS